MSLSLLHLRTAWNDHFPGTEPTNTYYSQKITSRQTPSVAGVYVSNCLSSSITSSSDGGVFYCTSVTYFLVESSSLFSCKTSGSHYGAIYFSNRNSGQSVLHKVCCNDCCANTYYQFARINVNNIASSKNNVNYSSFARCLNQNSNSHYILALQYGKICCSSINISLNKIYGYSGITSWPTLDSNSVTSLFTYSSFSDNTATGYVCFWLNTVSANYEMKSCNIIRSTQVSLDTYGTIYISGNLMIDDSCILENIANRIFHQGSSYTVTLSKCTVDKTTSTGSFVIQNTVTKSFIHALNHMSTRNCHSEYDSAGYLTPILQTPTSSKKPVICYTYGRCFYQPRLTDIFSLTCVFIFNFIQSGTLSYSKISNE
jgi:hypothetical protein